jgi:hypothetical protein
MLHSGRLLPSSQILDCGVKLAWDKHDSLLPTLADVKGFRTLSPWPKVIKLLIP